MTKFEGPTDHTEVVTLNLPKAGCDVLKVDDLAVPESMLVQAQPTDGQVRTETCGRGDSQDNYEAN